MVEKIILVYTFNVEIGKRQSDRQREKIKNLAVSNKVEYYHGKNILYQMIPHPYQNPINDRHVCKNNYSLTRLSFVSGVVIFDWHVSHLVDFDTVYMVSFDTKYLLTIMRFIQCGKGWYQIPSHYHEVHPMWKR